MSTQTGTQTVTTVTFTVNTYAANDPTRIVTTHRGFKNLDVAIEFASDVEDKGLGNAVILRNEVVTMTTNSVVTDFR